MGMRQDVLLYRTLHMTHLPMPKLLQGLPPVREAQQQHALVSSIFTTDAATCMYMHPHMKKPR